MRLTEHIFRLETMQRCVDSMTNGAWINNEFDNELGRLVDTYQTAAAENVKAAADPFAAHLQALELGSFSEYISNEENSPILQPKQRRRRRLNVKAKKLLSNIDENSNLSFAQVTTGRSNFSPYKQANEANDGQLHAKMVTVPMRPFAQTTAIDFEMPQFDSNVSGMSSMSMSNIF